MLVSRLRTLSPQFVRAASSFPPKKTKPAPSARAGLGIDPGVFDQVRQQIIERHNSADLDQPNVQHFNTNVLNIRRALQQNDLALLAFSWEELYMVQRTHLLSRNIIEQIANLVTSHDGHLEANGIALVGQVALASAAMHDIDSLNLCLLDLLKRGQSQTIIELYEKFRQSLGREDPDLVLESPSCHPDFFLAVVAAHAMQGNFHSALASYLNAQIIIPRRSADSFFHSISSLPTIQRDAKVYFDRLDLAKTIHLPIALSKHIYNLSVQPQSSRLEQLYTDVIASIEGPEAFIAARPELGSGSKPVTMTELSWASFLVAFLRRKRNDLATKVWEDMERLAVETGTLIWNLVMDGYSDFGTPDDVYGAWNAMLSRQVQPDSMSYRALLSCLFKARLADDAIRLLEVFRKEVQPTALPEHVLAVYNSVLHGVLSLGRDNAEFAFALFEEMEKKGPKPDLVSFNTIMSYHARQRDFKSMASVINRMSEAKVTGDVFTFSTILNALLRAGRNDATDLVLNIMRRQGVKPTVATYTSIITSQIAEQTIPHLNAALRLLDDMEKSHDTQPNEVTYTSIISGLYRGTWLPVEERTRHKDDILAQIRARKIRFHLGGYHILIKACLESEDENGVQDALRFYDEMKRNNVRPVDDTWYILLTGLRNRGEWQLAREIVGEIETARTRPSNDIWRLVWQIRQHSER